MPHATTFTNPSVYALEIQNELKPWEFSILRALILSYCRHSMLFIWFGNDSEDLSPNSSFHMPKEIVQVAFVAAIVVPLVISFS